MRCITLRGAILGSLFALVLSGCERSGEITEPQSEWQSTSALLDQESPQDLTPYHAIARAVALALDDEVVRGELLRSMRMSKYNENKLVLQAFLERAESSSLRSKVTERLGGADDLLKRLAAALPGDVDFYAPSREQRLSWTGSDRFVVAAVADPDADQALAFGPNGTGQVITSLDNRGIDIVFAIHPAEHKTEYPNFNPREGDRIEDPVGSGAVFQVCLDPETCGGGGGGGGPPPTPPGTYVTNFYPCFEDGFLAGRPEIYFQTFDSSQTEMTTTPRQVDPWTLQNIALRIYPVAASSSNPLTAVLWEDDSALTFGDDRYGEAYITMNGGRASLDFITNYSYQGCSPSSQLPVVWAEYQVYLED